MEERENVFVSSLKEWKKKIPFWNYQFQSHCFFLCLFIHDMIILNRGRQRKKRKKKWFWTPPLLHALFDVEHKMYSSSRRHTALHLARVVFLSAKSHWCRSLSIYFLHDGALLNSQNFSLFFALCRLGCKLDFPPSFLSFFSFCKLIMSLGHSIDCINTTKKNDHKLTDIVLKTMTTHIYGKTTANGIRLEFFCVWCVLLSCFFFNFFLER